MKVQNLLAVLIVTGVGLFAQAQFQPIRTCASLSSRGLSSSASQCNAAVAGKFLSAEADSVCDVLAQAGYSSTTVQCIQASVDANFEPLGLQVCRELASRALSSATVDCVKTLKNKMIDQRIIGSCLQLAQSGYSTSTVDCVRNTVIGELGAYPQPGNQNTTQILNLINRAREALAQRNTQSALRFLDRIEQLVRQN